jgi:hypothetical protein
MLRRLVVLLLPLALLPRALRRRVGLPLAVLLLLATSTGVRAQATCSYDASSHDVAIQIPSQPDAFSQTTVSSLEGQIWVNGAACGGAALSNTDTIRVNGTSDREELILYGMFAPGLTPESAGEPEIELLIDLADGINHVDMFMGSDGRDHVVIGSLGADLNADGDVDLVTTGLMGLGYWAFRGDDLISARGGPGAGGPRSTAVFVVGGGGNDRLLGGPAGDTLLGRGGRDVLKGGAGRDHLFGENGNDRLIGGKGTDSLSGGRGDDFCDPGSRQETVAFDCERPAEFIGES